MIRLAASQNRLDGRAERPPVQVRAVHWADVCAPWRVTTPLRALSRFGYVLTEATVGQPCDLDGVELLLLHRPNQRESLALIDEARRRGIASVADVDDLFLPGLLPEHAPFTRNWDPLFHRWEAEEQVALGLKGPEAIAAAPRNEVMERFHACLAAVDAVTVSTPELAEAYRQFNPNIFVLPNYYDDRNPLWQLTPPRRAGVNLGFYGTDHHEDNLQELRGVLEGVLRRHPEASVVEAGGPALLPRVDAPTAQLVHLGSLPFEVFPLLLLQMDVVLAPLADEPFMRCKSNIRCMTAGLARAPVVASPVGPYREYVRPGFNGFLADTADEWEEHLERLVGDAERRRATGEGNRRSAEPYAISVNAWQWVSVYDELLGRDRGARSAAPVAGHAAGAA